MNTIDINNITSHHMYHPWKISQGST